MCPNTDIYYKKCALHSSEIPPQDFLFRHKFDTRIVSLSKKESGRNFAALPIE